MFLDVSLSPKTPVKFYNLSSRFYGKEEDNIVEGTPSPLTPPTTPAEQHPMRIPRSPVGYLSLESHTSSDEQSGFDVTEFAREDGSTLVDNAELDQYLYHTQTSTQPW